VCCVQYLKSFTWGQQVLSCLFWPFEVAADSISVGRALYFTKEVVVGPKVFCPSFCFFPCCIWNPSQRFVLLVKGLFFLYSIWNPSPSFKKEKKAPTIYKG
jgi:hypothetical protein